MGPDCETTVYLFTVSGGSPANSRRKYGAVLPPSRIEAAGIRGSSRPCGIDVWQVRVTDGTIRDPPAARIRSPVSEMLYQDASIITGHLARCNTRCKPMWIAVAVCTLRPGLGRSPARGAVAATSVACRKQQDLLRQLPPRGHCRREDRTSVAGNAIALKTDRAGKTEFLQLPQ